MTIKEKYIKPIPKQIALRIRKKDANRQSYGYVRFYAYLAKMKGELVKITVACKNYKEQWFCKQVAVHGIHSKNCLVRDMERTMMGYSVGWYVEGLATRRKGYEDGKWYSAQNNYYDPITEIVNVKYALKFDAYKYSAVDKYPYCDVLKYLRIYEQYPQAEYFIKIGLQHLATSKILLRKAAKDKGFRKWLIHNAKLLRNKYGNYPHFTVQTILSSYKANVSILKEQAFEIFKRDLLQNYYYKNTISKVIAKSETKQFMNYIQKQGINISSYADYIKACTYLGLDMSLPKNLYPHDFQHWHDMRIDQFHTAKALKDAEERKELYAKFATVAEKYIGLQRNKEAFIVVIARSPQDLIREGDTLHHCVGRMNYDQKFAREESLIFFVRNANEPDILFVTVEYSLQSRKILQCYGEREHRPTDDVLAFVNKKWLPYANRKLKQIATQPQRVA